MLWSGWVVVALCTWWQVLGSIPDVLLFIPRQVVGWDPLAVSVGKRMIRARILFQHTRKKGSNPHRSSFCTIFTSITLYWDGQGGTHMSDRWGGGDLLFCDPHVRWLGRLMHICKKVKVTSKN
jgi:hypothetical protein